MTSVLLGLAASVAVIHTAIGIDHALPFIVLSRVQGWSLKRTLVVTALCGLGHIASAVVLGLAAAGLGVAAERLVRLEETRGHLALALLVAFGLGYAALGAVRLLRRRPHTHGLDGLHSHEKVVTTWTLFVVLVFGPCEALVPLLLAPGVMQSYGLLAAIVGVFGLLTVLTMLVLVTLGVLGARLLSLEKRVGLRLAGASEVLAGLAIAATGVVVGALGL